MMTRHYFKMHPSETAIFRSASDIFAGYVASGVVNADNEQTYMDKATDIAIKLAYAIERSIQSDDEPAGAHLE